MKKTKKRKLTIAVESNFNDMERAYLEERYELKTYTFQEILKKRIGLNFIFFSGGSDVNPELYGEEKGSRTGVDIKRDELCQEVFNSYMRTPKLGICRGSQLVTVLSGGKLIQHVEGHATGHQHEIEVHYEGHSNPTTRLITSTHHQMMYPFNLENNKYNLLGWTKVSRSMIYLDGEDKQIKIPSKFVEPEIIYYPDTRSLAIQGHPEFPGCNKNTKTLCLDLIDNYLL